MVRDCIKMLFHEEFRSHPPQADRIQNNFPNNGSTFSILTPVRQLADEFFFLY